MQGDPDDRGVLPAWFDEMWMTDATPAPCGMSRETVKCSDLAGQAGKDFMALTKVMGLRLLHTAAASGATEHRGHQQTITCRLRPLAIFKDSII